MVGIGGVCCARCVKAIAWPTGSFGSWGACVQDVNELVRQLTVCSDDERIALVAAIQRKEQQLRIINDFAVSLIKITSVDDLAWYVAKEVVGRMGFVDCVLYELDTDNNLLVQKAAIGEKNPKDRTIVNRLKIPVGIGVTGRVAKNRRPELIADLQTDSDYVPDISPARSELCVPLLNDNQLLGVIDCEDPRPGHFTADHLDILTAVAALTSSKFSELQAVSKVYDQSQMLESVREAVTITDMNGTILDCNESATDIYGYARSDLLGRSVGDFYANKETWAAVQEDQMLHLKTRGSWRGNIEVIEGAGKILTMDISLTPFLDEKGDQVATIAVARDISRLVASEKAIWKKNEALQAKQSELETALQEGEMARQASLAKDAFLANTSHELRTPLTGVIGMIDLMKRTTLDSEQQELVTAANTSARALLAIIDDILDLAKIEAGKISLNEQAFEPVEMVRMIADALRQTAEQKELEFELILPNPAPYTLIGDSSRIRQILFNIIGNAVKFTDEGSIRVKLELSPAGRNCNFSVLVEDTGIGFTEEEAALLFARFEQLDGSTTKNTGGTGLGLAISSELAGLMGGTLTATGTPGVGAVFRFEAPFKKGELPEVVPVRGNVQQVKASQSPLRILVAEDNPVNQMLIRKLLGRFPWRLTIVENGQQALEALDGDSDYDAVLMDIRMPVLDGVQATARIRQSQGDIADVPILALTANTMEADRTQYKEVGINAVVGKPINLDDLLAAVETHVIAND